MWRGRRTDRLTTEDCICFDTSDLRRAGLFRTAPGTPCTARRPDPSGKEPFGVTFWMLPGSNGRAALHLTYALINVLTDPRTTLRETILLDTTPCHFGGFRFWFICPRLPDGFPCNKRVRTLYLPPDSRLFGCRTCYNLTYRSCQEHDARVNALLSLSPTEFRRRLASRDPRVSLQALRAETLLIRRLLKKAAR